ncbi:MAG: cation transporter [Vicinamibacterales bacterium]|jgi:copper chaperone CopZ
MSQVLILVAALAIGGIATAPGPRGPATQATPAEATKVCTLKVTGMTCSGCEAAVKLAAKQIDGVKAVKASYAKGMAEVTFDPAKTTPDEIAKRIADKTGYKTEVVK